jgi:RNA methyltransferase, TrmH family
MPPLAARNHEIQSLRRLLRRRSARSEAGRYVIEGPRLVVEAIDAAVPLDAVYVPDDASGADLDALLVRCRDAGLVVRVVAAGVIDQVASTQSPQPALAIATPTPATFDDVLRTDAVPFVLVLHDVADPGNAGTLLRVAEAVGAGVVACGPRAVDVHNPKVVRAAAGALFRVPVVEHPDGRDALGILRERGIRIVGTTLDGATDLDEIELRGPVALVLGNEAHGLPDDVVATVDVSVRIPMRGAVESLNVAMAGTVLAFEAARQRRGGSHAP